MKNLITGGAGFIGSHLAEKLLSMGEEVVVVPAIKTEDIPAKFPKGFTLVKPYLRLTPQPNK